MADELRSAPTMNYGWAKPTVGGDQDVWGGELNATLDGIDSVVHGIDTRPPYSLPPASTTVLGGVKVDGTSVRAAGDGTISTVLVPMGDNRIINGDMRIDQRNNGASGTANAYPVDRWNFGNVVGHGTWGRNIGSLASAPGFPYYLGFSTSGAYTPAVGEAFQFSQPIEADAISDFQWGTASAQPVALSFWAYSNIAGSFSGCLGNYASTRSYPFSFPLVANTWTKISITIPGDTGGSWVLSGNSGGATLYFDLGSGANVRGPANAWASSGLVGVTGAASLLTAANQYLFVTGVKLEIGSVATPFNRQSLAKSMADCQRYYQLGYIVLGTYSPSGATAFVSQPPLVTMRASPTLGVLNNASSGLGVITPTSDTGKIFLSASTIAAGTYTFNYSYFLTAEL